MELRDLRYFVVVAEELHFARAAPAERAGTASGVLNTSRQLGGAIAEAVFGAFVAQRESFVSGVRVSLAMGAILLLATMVASLRLSGKSAYA